MRTLLVIAFAMILGCGDATPEQSSPKRKSTRRPEFEQISAELTFPKPWKHGRTGVVGVSFAAETATRPEPQSIGCDDFPKGVRPQLEVLFLCGGKPLGKRKWANFDKDC
jgi:hypothetical protein